MFKAIAPKPESAPPKDPEPKAIDVRKAVPDEEPSVSLERPAEVQSDQSDREAAQADDDGPRAEIDVIRIRHPKKRRGRRSQDNSDGLDRRDRGNKQEKAA